MVKLINIRHHLKHQLPSPRKAALKPKQVIHKMTEYFSFDQLHRCCGDTNSMTLNDEHYGNKPSFNNKKFTIAAILGLKNEINSKEKQYKERRNQYTPQKKNRSKRVRTIFTPEQLERLEAEFERQQYMVGPERLYLAHALHLTEGQVKVWFQNRRIKWRKRYVELTHQRLAALKEQRKINREEKSEPSEAM